MTPLWRVLGFACGIALLRGASACENACVDDVERCRDQSGLNFSQQPWLPGDYEVKFHFEGYAAKCAFTLPDPPTNGLANFTACETDATYADEPDADPHDSELVHLFDAEGRVVGIAAIIISAHLAQGHVRVVVAADGVPVFDEQLTEIMIGEIDDGCQSCETRAVHLPFP